MEKITLISKATFGGQSKDLVLNGKITIKCVSNFKAKFSVNK